jgi:predicted DNA-binding transcriptional regulator YafY
VLEWGKRARVIEPPELAERVREELEGALAHYEDGKRAAAKAKPKR